MHETTPRVLVVDDDKDVRRMMVMALEDDEREVVETSDAAMALALLRSSPVRWLVLLDWKMPGMSGEDLLEIVHAERRLATRHAYVLVTANAAALTPQFSALLSDLSIPILPKPFNIATLLATVDAHVSRLDREPAEETA